MLVQPNTTIKLIRSCPLDVNYENTLWFDSESDQESYFKSLAGLNFTKQSYQRYARGWISIQAKADMVYDCNYMMFQNTSYGNKWFYAFITTIEYVNDNTTRIRYEIDVMQTYLFDVVPNQCFVEREHSETDEIGDNLVHEDVYFGPYVYGETATPKRTVGGRECTMDDMAVVVVFNTSFLTTIFEKWSGIEEFFYSSNFYSGVYQGVTFAVFPTWLETAQSKLKEMFSAIDFLSFGGFVTAFMMPYIFLPSDDEFNQWNVDLSFNVHRNTSFSGYVPRNNKLFTYPYTCAYLTSNRGTGNEFAFEYSSMKDYVSFRAEGNLAINTSVIAFPIVYKNVSYFYEGAVSIPSYPICTWGADGVTEWVNNNLLKSVATAGVLGAAGVNPATAFIAPSSETGLRSAQQPVGYYGRDDNFVPTSTPMFDPLLYASGVENAVPRSYLTLSAVGRARAEFDPGTVHGNVEGDVMFGSVGGRKIYGMVKRITAKYAEIVDQYFDHFGYACNQWKVPNRNSRPHWNYVKTNGFTFRGSVPADSAKRICSIYDKGITFWKHASEIGTYKVGDSYIDNRPE